MSRVATAVIVLALSSGLAPAQPATLHPGGATLRTSRIRAGTDSFRIESNFGGQARRSTMVRTVSRAARAGREEIVFAQRYFTAQGITVDTSWLDAASLAPLRYFAEVYGEVQSFTFSGTSGSGTVTPKDSASRPITVSAATPFFNAVAIDLIYASLPLAADFSAQVPLYNPPRASFTVTLRVTGEEDLALAAGGSVRAWTVDYQLGPNTQKLWLDRRTGEFLKIGGTQGANYFYKYRADLKPPTPGS